MSQQHASVSLGWRMFGETDVTRISLFVHSSTSTWSDPSVSPFTSIVLISFAANNYCLVGLLVKVSTTRAGDPGFESRLCWDFCGVRVIPVTWKLAHKWLPCQAPGIYRVSAGTGWPGVSILRLGEMESLVCNFFFLSATNINILMILLLWGGCRRKCSFEY